MELHIGGELFCGVDMLKPSSTVLKFPLWLGVIHNAYISLKVVIVFTSTREPRHIFISHYVMHSYCPAFSICIGQIIECHEILILLPGLDIAYSWTKNTVLWSLTACSQDSYSEEGGSTFIRNRGKSLSDYTASRVRTSVSANWLP